MERSCFLFFSLVLEVLGQSNWLGSSSFLAPLLSRVTSSNRVYLLVMARISSDILGFFHREHANQGWLLESLLEEHDDGLVIDLWYNVLFVVETLDEFLEGLPSYARCSPSHSRLLVAHEWPGS
jgi:hypothetical protein